MIVRIFRRSQAGAQAGIPAAVFPLRAQRRAAGKGAQPEGRLRSALPRRYRRGGKTTAGIAALSVALRAGQIARRHARLGFRIGSLA
jgi:hypothetical protein